MGRRCKARVRGVRLLIDRGISEHYILLWLDAAWWERERIEQTLSAARTVARHGAGGRSLVQLYEGALTYYGGNQVLAAEFLRRALKELAQPTPIDDTLPDPDSPVWEIVRTTQWFWSSRMARTSRF